MQKLPDVSLAIRLVTVWLALTLCHPASADFSIGGSTACDPTKQSCTPNPDGNGSGGGAGMCKPSPGGSTCGGAGPASQGNTSDTNQGAGNPINLINGNKYQREVDMPALPGVLGLEIVRHYNSQYSLPNVPTGVLGHGWKLSYETELHDSAAGLQIVQADGTRVIFQRSKDQPSHCTSPDPANGSVTVLDKPQGKEYLWRWPGNGKEGGRQLLFNSQGKLVQIAAPTGEYLSLLYSPKGWLLQVRDPQGRELNLNYLDAQTAQADPDGTHTFRGVQTIDSPVGRFSYGYGNELPTGSSASQTLTLANLTQVGIPTWHDPSTRTFEFANRSPSRSSITRHYHYEDPNFPTLLTGISVQGSGSDGVQLSQRLSTYGYDRRGRAILSQKADGIEKVSLNTDTPGQTILTNALGQKTVYKHAQIAGQWRLLESRGAGCAQCGPANMRYNYDQLARLTQQTRLDLNGQPLSATRTTRDAQSRTLRIETISYHAGKPGAPQLQVRYEYPSDQATEPSLIATPSVLPGREHQIRIHYNAQGQPTEISETGYEPLNQQTISRSTRYHYKSINNNSVLVEIDGPLPNGPSNSPRDSDITALEWDRSGSYVTSLQVPGGEASAATYDKGTGLLTEVRNGEGLYTQFVYDPRQQLVTLRSGGPGWRQPRVQSWRYDAFGNATEEGSGESTNDDAGSSAKPYQANKRQSFDAVDRLQWRASALGILSTWQYDAESHVTGTARYSNSIAMEQSIRFNDQGQLSSFTNNQGQGFRFDYTNGGALAHITDALGRMTAASERGATNQNGATDSPTYRGPHLRQQRDDFGRTVAVTSPDSGTTTRTFDAADRMRTSSDAQGNHAQYAYDQQGRIERQVITNGSTGQATETRWVYQGRYLKALHHPAQSERYEYDDRGLRIAKIVTLNTSSGEHISVTRYQFDDAGVLQANSLPDGSRIVYERNGQGQVIAVRREVVQTPWLRWMAPAQILAREIQRDIVGLKRYVTGNDIEVTYQRSREGALARVVYRRLKAKPETLNATNAMQSAVPHLFGQILEDGMGLFLGMRPAGAAQSAVTPMTSPKQMPAALPGALGLPADPLALLDHRYLWDVNGNLLHTQDVQVNADGPTRGTQSYAYDHADRLIAFVQANPTARFNTSPGAQQASRYHYDAEGRRDLSQQHIEDQAELGEGTQRISYQRGTHRWAYIQNTKASYNANGQPERIGEREYVWDALGRLVEVRQENKNLASYTYNHRGERVLKTAGGQTTAYLYEEKQLNAELDAQGQLVRQFIYLADLPLAVIDTTQGKSLAKQEQSIFYSLGQDLKTLLMIWSGHSEQPVWLHGNHLGAPEAATDASGNLIWQSRYQPFGAASLQSKNGFTLHLRLPGQYEDTETGLYYNRQRYYDPEQGQYLSPDPAGNPDGANGYAYVRNNPLKYIDPEGLILFAFDGTGNSEDEKWLDANDSSYSNVVLFKKIYASDNGLVNYISGVGVLHHDDKYDDIIPPIGDSGFNLTGPARIDRMLQYFNDEAATNADDTAMDVDIIGFSRGASEAREFANRIVSSSKQDSQGDYWYSFKGSTGEDQCKAVNFRFIGLWDTVLSTNLSGTSYNFAIPQPFRYVAQAVALNEYRGDIIHPYGSIGAFPVESILPGQFSSTPTPGQIRVEMGFIGAHADIGGGFPVGENQLPQVTLSWMVQHARNAGVTMDDPSSTIIANPVIHDKSDSILSGVPASRAEDRQVRYADGSTTSQRQMVASGNSMGYADTQQFISYLPTDDSRREKFVTGAVDMKAYLDWLRDHGYDLGNLEVQ